MHGVVVWVPLLWLIVLVPRQNYLVERVVKMGQQSCSFAFGLAAALICQFFSLTNLGSDAVNLPRIRFNLVLVTELNFLFVMT